MSFYLDVYYSLWQMALYSAQSNPIPAIGVAAAIVMARRYFELGNLATAALIAPYPFAVMALSARMENMKK